VVEWRPEEDVMNWMEKLSQKTDARGEALSILRGGVDPLFQNLGNHPPICF
jgi:hypothetical protein